MMFWVWAALILLAVLGFVALLFGYVGVPRAASASDERAPAARPWPLYAGGALVVLLAAGLFGWMARPTEPQGDLPRIAASEPPTAQDPREAEVAQMVAQLEARMEQTPDDPEGWRMLGWTRFQMGQFPAAVAAYSRAEALAPDNGDTQAALGEAMVMAAEGTVSPEAQTRFRRALQLLPGDPRARYYLAAARDQAGDTKGAIADWVAIVNESPPDAPLTIELRNLVTQRAREAGVDISGTMPDRAAAPAAPAPSASQVAEAQAMAPEDRQAMIRGMVDGLDARLAESPQDVAGWQRLIRARMVLGEPERAAAALKRAEAALADNPEGLAAVRAEATSAGLRG